jgi:hypothetical protein
MNVTRQSLERSMQVMTTLCTGKPTSFGMFCEQTFETCCCSALGKGTLQLAFAARVATLRHLRPTCLDACILP